MKTRQVIGFQPVREAIRAHGRRITQLWLLDIPRLAGLAKFATDNQVGVTLTDKRALDQLCAGAMHQGAICEAPALRLCPAADLFADPMRLVLALDGIQDPQNFGAVVRSAVGIGQAAVLWPENSSAPLTASTFRASAGAIEHATLCRVPSLTNALIDATAVGMRVIGLDAHGERALRECDLTQPTLLVLGGEGRGLGRSVRKHCAELARLVAPTTIDSLNASVSAALALYEVMMQRAAGAPRAHEKVNSLTLL